MSELDGMPVSGDDAAWLVALSNHPNGKLGPEDRERLRAIALRLDVSPTPEPCPHMRPAGELCPHCIEWEAFDTPQLDVSPISSDGIELSDSRSDLDVYLELIEAERASRPAEAKLADEIKRLRRVSTGSTE